MEQELTISYFKPEEQGVFRERNQIRFAAEIKSDCSSGIILYDESGKLRQYPFSTQGKRGNLYGICITGEHLSSYQYNYYSNDKIITDPYARGIAGLEKWGCADEMPRITKGKIIEEDYDWEDDRPLFTSYEDSIIYGLNVRGFTMHKSSGVKDKGTFEGILQKLPHLKKIGITAIELMPAYEYDECMLPVAGTVKDIKRVNLWGFQQGFYFTPKASFAAGTSPAQSFKNMVKELHKNGIEVWMQFYFESGIRHSFILDVLKYWVIEYHIDGMRLSGTNLPLDMIAEEPVLKDTKIRGLFFKEHELLNDELPFNKNLSIGNEQYRIDMRKFLKSDEGLINQFIFWQKNNPARYGSVNYLSDYDGFSLYDCVSYERKHNMENGENNQDGTDYNYTWNCGTEGESRKKATIALRKKQIKNALSLLFFSQGSPFIFSGDEMGNSKMGNNNAYCQDNEIGWIKWKNNQLTEEILGYFCFLITMRKKYSILHMKKEFQVMDTKACGFPDISYHGAEAWRPDLNYSSRLIGIMLCGNYTDDPEKDFFYIAYNMHWEPHKLALPKLSKGMQWVKITDTSETEFITEVLQPEEAEITVGERSISVYKSQFVSEKARILLQKTVKYEATAF